MDEKIAEPAKPLVLTPKPVTEPVDWQALIKEVQSDFPKTLARLAE